MCLDNRIKKLNFNYKNATYLWFETLYIMGRLIEKLLSNRKLEKVGLLGVYMIVIILLIGICFFINILFLQFILYCFFMFKNKN